MPGAAFRPAGSQCVAHYVAAVLALRTTSMPPRTQTHGEIHAASCSPPDSRSNIVLAQTITLIGECSAVGLNRKSTRWVKNRHFGRSERCRLSANNGHLVQLNTGRP